MGEVTKSNKNMSIPLQEGDFYMENGLMVLTAQYLLKRGECCGSGCRHCPFKKSKK